MALDQQGRHALIPDSGGAGRHRGGLGVERVVGALAPIAFNSQIDRAHCKPWGLEGGLEATGNEVGLTLDVAWRSDFPNAKLFLANLKPGDAYRVRSGGAGLWPTVGVAGGRGAEGRAPGLCWG